MIDIKEGIEKMYDFLKKRGVFFEPGVIAARNRYYRETYYIPIVCNSLKKIRGDRESVAISFENKEGEKFSLRIPIETEEEGPESFDFESFVALWEKEKTFWGGV